MSPMKAPLPGKPTKSGLFGCSPVLFPPLPKRGHMEKKKLLCFGGSGWVTTLPPSYHTLSPNAVGQPWVTFPGLKAGDIWFPDGARVEEGLGEERGPPL